MNYGELKNSALFGEQVCDGEGGNGNFSECWLFGENESLRSIHLTQFKALTLLNHNYIFIFRSGIYIHSDLNQPTKLINIFFFFLHNGSLLITLFF